MKYQWRTDVGRDAVQKYVQGTVSVLDDVFKIVKKAII